jgi:hypothetical protein
MLANRLSMKQVPFVLNPILTLHPSYKKIKIDGKNEMKRKKRIFKK